MYFEITHKTTYRYSRPVFLEPHTLKLRPRCDGLQNLTQFDCTIEPRPAGVSDGVDLDGNVSANVWFEGLTELLVIESRSKVFTRYRNPFNYVLADRSDRLPVSYLEPIQAYVAPYTVRQRESHYVEQFARHIANLTEWKTLRFLTALNREIHECCRQIAREPGVVQPAEETVLHKRGSSRDLAVLFIEACRYVGIAARFVNGYHDSDGDADKRCLHSWGEVYLPGVGWRGYDPSQGLAVTDQHVALAGGGIPLLAAPVVGTFRGNAVNSELNAEIDIRVVADNEMNLTAGATC
jgi:transglutaminase-like putative cysteine protease